MENKMNETKQWIKNIEKYYSNLLYDSKIPSDLKNIYKTDDKNWKFLIFPEILSKVEKMKEEKKIRFHSITNPKSSQLLAINLFLPLENNTKFFNNLFNNNFKESKINFEWIDNDNILNQKGTQSNHDLLVDFGKVKYLIEIKYTENEKSVCSSKIKNEECEKNLFDIFCPLEKIYDTKYYKILKEDNSPYDLEKLSKAYDNCPFLNGIQYQLMRYILFCFEKSKGDDKWFPVIIYSKNNKFIETEILNIKNLLKNKDFLIEIKIEDIINKEIFDNKHKKWLIERYINNMTCS